MYEPEVFRITFQLKLNFDKHKQFYNLPSIKLAGINDFASKITVLLFLNFLKSITLN